jgi:NAD(P)-dependent dehydrogenase (short-subunit alcohol dehydrogenase family)
MNLENKVIAVIGASSGIGEGIVRALNEYHPRGLVLAARREEKLREIANSLKSETLIVPTDVTDRSQIEKFFTAAITKYGRLDAVINSAGVIQQERPHDGVEPEIIDKIISANLLQVLHVAQHAARIFKRQSNGIYLVVSSHAGQRVFPGEVVYNASKAGVDHAIRTLSAEWELYRTNGQELYAFALGPGLIDTSEARSKFPTVPEEVWQRAPKPIDFGRTALQYLINPKEKFRHGAVHLIETVTF